jgi:archaellum biogenesis protein FlaJ (TadC family)
MPDCDKNNMAMILLALALGILSVTIAGWFLLVTDAANLGVFVIPVIFAVGVAGLLIGGAIGGRIDSRIANSEP